MTLHALVSGTRAKWLFSVLNRALGCTNDGLWREDSAGHWLVISVNWWAAGGGRWRIRVCLRRRDCENPGNTLKWYGNFNFELLRHLANFTEGTP